MAEIGIIDIQAVIFQVFNFLVLLFLLNKFLYKPLIGLLEKRVKKVEEITQKEKELNEKLEKIDLEKAVVLRQAKEQAKESLSNAKSESAELAAKIEYEARKKADQIIDNAKLQAQEYLKQANKQIEEKVRSMAVEISEEIIASDLTPDQRDRIMKSSIKVLEIDG